MVAKVLCYSCRVANIQTHSVIRLDSNHATANNLLDTVFPCLHGGFRLSSALTNEYLQYATRSKVSVKFPRLIIVPYLSFCTRIGEAADKAKTMREANVKFENSEQYHKDVMNKLTLKQMFRVTPAAKDALSSCMVRIPGRYLVEEFKRATCNDLFKIRKYFMQEYICYMVGLNTTSEYNFARISQAEQDRGLAYELRFSRTLFGRALHILNIIHRNRLPHNNRHYAQVIRRIYERGKEYSNEVYYGYTYSQFMYELLPDPYDTACGTNEGLVHAECQQICVTDQVLKTFGKLPTDWLVEEDDVIDVNRKLLTTDEFARNQTALNAFLSLDSECAEKCRKAECHFVRYNTDLLDTNENENATTITVRVMLPQFPGIFVTYVPIYEPNDYVLLLMSCMGTWLGVSMIDFNPARLCSDSKNCDCDDRLRNVNAKCRYLKNKVHVYENRLANVVQQLSTMRSRLDAHERQLSVEPELTYEDILERY